MLLTRTPPNAVKPTSLMAYLVRLVTPPGGIVFDPFMGSGSTGKACMREGFMFIGCDLEREYVEIARQRIEFELRKDAERIHQRDIFTPKNQCDGCNTGAPMRDGLHTDETGAAFMVCQADRYTNQENQ